MRSDRPQRSGSRGAATGLTLALVVSACSWPLPLPDARERQESAPPAETAQRWIEVHWGHGAGTRVLAFKLYWGLSAGEYLAVEEVHPRPEPDGSYLARLRVPATQTVHVAVSAVGPGGESPVSNQGICTPGCRRATPVSETARPH